MSVLIHELGPCVWKQKMGLKIGCVCLDTRSGMFLPMCLDMFRHVFRHVLKGASRASNVSSWPRCSGSLDSAECRSSTWHPYYYYYHPCKKNSAGGGENALTHPPKMAGGVGRKCKRNPRKSKRNGGRASG